MKNYNNFINESEVLNKILSKLDEISKLTQIEKYEINVPGNILTTKFDTCLIYFSEPFSGIIYNIYITIEHNQIFLVELLRYHGKFKSLDYKNPLFNDKKGMQDFYNYLTSEDVTTFIESKKMGLL